MNIILNEKYEEKIHPFVSIDKSQKESFRVVSSGSIPKHTIIAECDPISSIIIKDNTLFDENGIAPMTKWAAYLQYRIGLLKINSELQVDQVIQELYPRTFEECVIRKPTLKEAAKDEEELYLLASKLQFNFFGDPFDTESSLFGFPSFMNHSCVPNTLFKKENNKLILITTQDIQVGDELCYCYTIGGGINPDTRRKFIFDRCHFLCQCKGCIGEVNVMDSEQFKHIMKINNACAWCGKPEAGSKCSKCKMNYCNSNCQSNDWKFGHKKYCKKQQT